MKSSSVVNHHTLYLPSLTTPGSCLLGHYKRRPPLELPVGLTDTTTITLPITLAQLDIEASCLNPLMAPDWAGIMTTLPVHGSNTIIQTSDNIVVACKFTGIYGSHQQLNTCSPAPSPSSDLGSPMKVSDLFVLHAHCRVVWWRPQGMWWRGIIGYFTNLYNCRKWFGNDIEQYFCISLQHRQPRSWLQKTNTNCNRYAHSNFSSSNPQQNGTEQANLLRVVMSPHLHTPGSDLFCLWSPSFSGSYMVLQRELCLSITST